MSLLLPPQSSELRNMFSVYDLLPDAIMKLPRFDQAISSARRFLSTEKLARSVQSLCIRANGHIVLVQVGKRGAVKTLWDFSA